MLFELASFTPRVWSHRGLEEASPCALDQCIIRRKRRIEEKNNSDLGCLSFQVMIKLKRKNVGGAFSKKSKSKLVDCLTRSSVSCYNSQKSFLTTNFVNVLGAVYGVCDENSAWPYMKERDIPEEVYFGLKTGQGLIEFKCRSKAHKQQWVDGIRNLLRRVSSLAETDNSMRFLSINNSI